MLLLVLLMLGEWLQWLLMLAVLLGGRASWNTRQVDMTGARNLVHAVMVGGSKGVSTRRGGQGGVVGDRHRGGLTPAMSGAVLRES